mmetsp:Transcript_85399/g.198554  ORF Transcript_85399/g.198554 Transcript_85399/m.198554 type:complete len:220 (+) Transcript_85399:1148-1807(+)
MQITNGLKDLLRVRRGQRLPQALGTQDAVKELATGAELHDKVDLPAIAEDLVQPRNVGVVERFGHRNLALKVRDVLHCLDGDALDCTLHSTLQAPRTANAAESTFAEALAVELIKGMEFTRVLLRERVGKGVHQILLGHLLCLLGHKGLRRARGALHGACCRAKALARRAQRNGRTRNGRACKGRGVAHGQRGRRQGPDHVAAQAATEQAGGHLPWLPL